MLTTFRTRPAEIKAIQFTGDKSAMLAAFPGIHGNTYPYSTDEGLFIHTLEGDMHVSVGDWIIKGLRDELYPCKPDVFEKKYERVE